MKIRCADCGRKVEVDTDDRGIPKTDKCDRCLTRQRERELISTIADIGKKKKNWWRK